MDEIPHRVQRRRTKGWRMPPNTVYVGRGTPFGNPYKLNERPTYWPVNRPWGRAEAVECFELLLAGGWRLRRPPGFTIVNRTMRELEGKNLACYCPLDEPCHADVLLRYANAVVDLAGDLSA